MTFSAFWSEQIRKEAKKAAERAWNKALKEATAEEILAGWRRSRDHYSTRERQFIPLPSTWLNQGRWMDEYGDEPSAKEWYDRRHTPRCSQCKVEGVNLIGEQGKCHDCYYGLRVVK